MSKYELQKEYIIKNIDLTDIHSFSSLIPDFCQKFGLKISYAGVLEKNQTFTNVLKRMVEEELLEYAFSAKINRGWGGKGGNVIYYKFTIKGYSKRDMYKKPKMVLLNNERNQNEQRATTY
jgi:hypothetical protein